MNHARKLGLHALAGIACLAIVLSIGCKAWAVVLAYDGFDYTPGTFLVDSAGPLLNGGSGWAGAWDDTQGAPPAGVTHTDSIIQATSLQYTDSLGNALITAGGKLLNTGAGNNGAGPGTLTSQPGRSLTDRRASSAEGATISTWVSFLGQRIGPVNMDTPPNPNGFDGTYRRGANLALFDLGGAATQTEKFDIGDNSNQQYPLGGMPAMYEDRFQSRLPGVPATVTVAPPYAPNPAGSATSSATAAQVRDAFSEAKFAQIGLVVMRIDHVAGDANAATTGGSFGGNDNVYLWMNPILSSTPSDASPSIKHISVDIVAAANAPVAIGGVVTPVAPFNGNPTVTGSGSGGELDFNRIRLFAGNIAGTTPFAQLLFDEIRIGETFADVTPFVPVVTGLPGDFNDDDKVDAADYTTWRDNLGAPTEATLNGNGDGANGVDANDYTRWKDHFGESNGAGAGGASASGVPEPTTMLLAAIGISGFLVARRRAA